MEKEKNIYVKLMENLLGKEINVEALIYSPNDKPDYNYKLQESCNKFNKIMLKELEENKKKKENKELTEKEINECSFFVGTNKIRPDNVLEPCPICSSKKEKIYKYVFIGLNPYRETKFKDEESNAFSKKDTTRLNWINYNFPTDDVYKNRSVYKHISKNALGKDKYYDWVFRLHQALFHYDEGKIFDTWDELVSEAKSHNKDIEEFFLDEFYKFPILSAEMIPYKSCAYKANSKASERFIDEIHEYKKYIVELLKFIDNHTDKDSIIFFLGHTGNIKKILWKVKKDISLLPSCKNKTEFDKLYKKLIPNKIKDKKFNNHFYFFKYNGNNQEKRVIMSPFLISQGGGRIDLKKNDLIDNIISGRLFQKNTD